MKQITWHNETRKTDDLTPVDYNPRILTDKERADLEESITKFGSAEPIVINTGKRNNFLIGGHQRVMIYAELGIKEVDVRVPSRELTIEEETELNLRLNKNTGSWDWTKLKEYSIDQLIDVGFDDDEMADMWDDVGTFEDHFNIEKAVKEANTTSVKLGEIYQLGKHRIMCGDSMQIADVEKLMGGVRADMIYCDPPYNIGLDYNRGMGELYHNDQAYGGEHSKKADTKTAPEYKDFIETTVANALAMTKPDAHIFYWCDQNFIWLIQQTFKQQELVLKRVCLWVKNNMNLKPQTAFNKIYEPVVYATRGKPYLNRKETRLHEILNKEVETGNRVYDEVMDLFDIWLVQRDVDYLHPTQKPISLHEKPFKRCTAPGHVIIDLFGGSGSTLMACEQTKRTCYTMEKDPIFVQVAIDRWEQMTGEKAKQI